VHFRLTRKTGFLPREETLGLVFSFSFFQPPAAKKNAAATRLLSLRIKLKHKVSTKQKRKKQNKTRPQEEERV
jgi:hypothetical protein